MTMPASTYASLVLRCEFAVTLRRPNLGPGKNVLTLDACVRAGSDQGMQLVMARFVQHRHGHRSRAPAALLRCAPARFEGELLGHFAHGWRLFVCRLVRFVTCVYCQRRVGTAGVFSLRGLRVSEGRAPF